MLGNKAIILASKSDVLSQSSSNLSGSPRRGCRRGSLFRHWILHGFKCVNYHSGSFHSVDTLVDQVIYLIVSIPAISYSLHVTHTVIGL